MFSLNTPKCGRPLRPAPHARHTRPLMCLRVHKHTLIDTKFPEHTATPMTNSPAAAPRHTPPRPRPTLSYQPIPRPHSLLMPRLHYDLLPWTPLCIFFLCLCLLTCLFVFSHMPGLLLPYLSTYLFFSHIPGVVFHLYMYLSLSYSYT